MGAAQSATTLTAANATSSGGFCFNQTTPTTFHWYETAVHPHYISDVKGFPDWVRSFDRKSRGNDDLEVLNEQAETIPLA